MQTPCSTLLYSVWEHPLSWPACNSTHTHTHAQCVVTHLDSVTWELKLKLVTHERYLLKLKRTITMTVTYWQKTNTSWNTFTMWPPVSWLFLILWGKSFCPDSASETLKVWVSYHALSQSPPCIRELVVTTCTQPNIHLAYQPALYPY